MKRILYYVDVAWYLSCAYWAYRFAAPGTRKAVGFAVAAIGFGLWMLARFQLGRSFTVTAQAKGLVTHGLYKRFRHPVYTFSLAAFGGLMIAGGWYWGLLALPCVWFMQSVRMRKEDKVLEDAFGEQYRVYRAGTWM